jgi:ABC-type multidrug transport system fused ATPase/permease subunit
MSVTFGLPKHNPLRLVSYLRKYSGQFWIQAAGGIIYNTVIVAGPVLLGKMIDAAGALESEGVTPERVRTLALFAIGFVAATVFFQYGRYIKRWYLWTLTNKIACDMRAGLFSKVLRYPMARIERESVGDLMSRTVGDVDQITTTTRQTINEGWDTWLLMISYFVVLLWYDWSITLISSIPIPFAILLAQSVRHPVYRFSLGSRRAASVVTSHIQRTLGGLTILRLFGREHVETERLEDYSRSLMTWNIKTNLLQTAMMPVYATLASLGIATVIILGGRMVVEGTWTVGTFVAYLTMFSLMATRTWVAARIFNQFHAASASWHRIKDKLSEPEEKTEAAGHSGALSVGVAPAPVIQARNLSFRYPGAERDVLTGLSFTVDRGDFVGVTGPVGSGKSALALVLSGLYPYSGDVLVGGRSLNILSPAEKAKIFAYSGEDAFLFSASISRNITFLDQTRITPELGQREAAAVHTAALSDDMSLFPQGLETIVGERGTRLSGGQRQRVSLARAVFSGNPILILDDPFSAVDIGTERRMIGRMRHDLKGTTILVFSHRLASFAGADKILVLEKGRLIEQGNHAQLMASHGLYEKIYSAQTWMEGEGK